jgi:NADPH:quinone reductase-like Zn-dependent oxidoreductase
LLSGGLPFTGIGPDLQTIDGYRRGARRARTSCRKGTPFILYCAALPVASVQPGSQAMRLRYKIPGVLLAFSAVTLMAAAGYVSHEGECRPTEALAAGAVTMKAVVYRCYGGPEVLKFEDIAKPSPAVDEVLVRVHAAAVNPLDWHYLRGLPYIMRISSGVGAPEQIRMGSDFSGTVEAVGKNVTQYKPGDEVFGGRNGAFAEYVTVRETRALALKPTNLSFEQAATVPVAAITALQALRDIGALQPGQKVLINGASGGVGTFAVQIAKSMGAEVTGVCSTRNVAVVQALGADRVLDYRQEDFTRGSERYDLIIDNVGNHALSDLRRAMTATGTTVVVGGPSDEPFLGPLTRSIRAVLYSLFVRQKFLTVLAHENHEDLDDLRELMQAGKLTPVIDRRYPLAETAAAIQYVEDGHARGKVIVSVAPDFEQPDTLR